MVAAVQFPGDERLSVDASIDALASRKAVWRDFKAADKLAHLLRIRQAVDRHGAEWTANSLRIRGTQPGGPTRAKASSYMWVSDGRSAPPQGHASPGVLGGRAAPGQGF